MSANPTEPATGRDRLRELLEAVLDSDEPRLATMAGEAYSSPWHFARVFSRGTGEPPVALRRRVMLERAAWRLRRGGSVTDAADEAGYTSVEGFSRAFSRAYGHPPSTTPGPGGPWLPSPNGIHFHPPLSLWVESRPTPRSGADPTALLIQHDLDDTAALLDLVAELPSTELDRARRPGHTVLDWDGPEASVTAVLGALVWTKEIWLASITGADTPVRGPDDLPALRRRFAAVAPVWLSTVRELDRRQGWDDTLIDALCDPPESFVIGTVIAHVLTYSAYRRQLVRSWLREAGYAVDHGDPIEWLRGRD